MDLFTDQDRVQKYWICKYMNPQCEPQDFYDWEQNKQSCCCNYGRIQESEDYVERFNEARMIDYTIAMFEKRKGDALSYFSKRYKWSARDREEVSKIDEKYRVACTGCRNDYALQLVFKQLPPEIQDVEESVKCEFAYQNSEGYTNHFRPSFYFGGVFDSTKKMGTARSMIGLLNMLRGQYRAEVARYILKHDCTIEGYQRRFTFGETTKEAFYLASNIIFPKPSRPPIGLNPERIVGTCEAKGCYTYLHGCEYTVKYCEVCAAMPRRNRAKLEEHGK